MLTLEVVRGSAQGTKFPVDAGTITIGRAPTNQLVLSDWHLSGEHGQIFREEDQYIYKALRSTNGSRIRRGSEEFAVETHAEAILEDGDHLLLGDPNDPVVIVAHVDVSTARGVEILARRDIAELPSVEAAVERDPAAFRSIYEASKKLGRSRLDLNGVLETIAAVVLELVPRATNVGIDLVSADGKRVDSVFARARTGESVRTSRTIVRTVLAERAAMWAKDAPAKLKSSGSTSNSTLAMAIASFVAVPLWDGETIRGVLQADNRGARNGLITDHDMEVLAVVAGQATLAISNALLFTRLKAAEEKARSESKYLKTREEKRRFADIIGESPAMQNIFKQIDKVKDTRATVCIEGETGTGKELIASAIHYQGVRRDKLFVAQNCAAVPETLLESELFGHKKGAFTGADHDKKGLFEIADGGTLFLDEIGEMALGLQAKLLRVLQEGKIRPVGATVEKAVDVRIICATNRSLEKEVEAGKFRQDLYYRLKVFPLLLPPLRERRDDIEVLVRHFLARYEAEFKKNVLLGSETVDALVAYNWPGNIRELQNEVQRLVIQADAESSITPDMLSPQIRKVEGLLGRIAPKKGTLKDMMDDVERWLLAEALREHGGNKTKTAETLGITREGLHKKLAKYGM